jgi:hypothetical protein
VLRVALAISAALPAASRYRRYGWRATMPTPPTTSNTQQTIGSPTGTAKLVIVRRGSRARRASPQGGHRVGEPDRGND